MTGRSRILGLMARRTSAEIAREQAEMLRLSRTHTEAQGMVDRLGSMLEERRTKPGQGGLAADLRLNGALCAQIAAESARQQDRAAALEVELAAKQTEIARRDRKRQKLEEAYRDARTAEADAREARNAAALPPRMPGAGR
ncbi:hypothetical protein GCM10011452_01810 [Gemmobacter lanyuensis]|uniref:Flagellar FliJ protein n=1 Tax=Gemmobacter lanyuensis TaxID=1054497 RepID=A0A918MFK6_9RHOB|nr:hypothetical protein [Gemmobacter lanyuensis]GGW21441.1 hypothetical protein GCM10011452_01810 [Gemmobacter lanyuensis]